MPINREAQARLIELREQIGGMSLKKWEQTKEDFYAQVYSTGLEDEILSLASKDTITDTRIRVGCKRAARRRADEIQQFNEANPLYGSF